jgi:phosphatidate cytidylyltransferase
MAFNWKTFQTRTLTAIIFAAVMLTGLLWNQWSFLILFSIIHFGCWWEYLNLLEKINNVVYHRYISLGFMLIGFGIMLLFCDKAFQINGYYLNKNFSLPISIAGFVMLALGIFQAKQVKLKTFGTAALGLLYISFSWGLMINLYKEINIHVHDTLFVLKGPVIPLMIIISIWINDTMAYIVGSLIGKTPLSKVSPKKTWEGTIGGIILSVVVVGLIIHFDFNSLVITIVVIIFALISSVAGSFGDLLESKLKRMAGVKDSGSIMPGHGGFLDRFDSLLLATPAVWLYVYLVM